MSGAGFHVHGPHDHEIEHAVQHASHGDAAHDGDEQMHQHHRWAQATTALQVSIALAAIALLTKKKWLEWGMFGVAGVGAAIGVLAMLHI